MSYQKQYILTNDNNIDGIAFSFTCNFHNIPSYFHYVIAISSIMYIFKKVTLDECIQKMYIWLIKYTELMFSYLKPRC